MEVVGDDTSRWIHRPDVKAMAAYLNISHPETRFQTKTCLQDAFGRPEQQRNDGNERLVKKVFLVDVDRDVCLMNKIK